MADGRVIDFPDQPDPNIPGPQWTEEARDEFMTEYVRRKQAGESLEGMPPPNFVGTEDDDE